jgi:hypothetical protein
MEEFEMHIKVGDPFEAFAYVNEVKGSHSAEIVYFATFTDPIDQIKIHPEDHSGYIWLTEEEIESVYSNQKGGDDPEMQTVRKAFALLKGSPLAFGD